MADMLNDRAEAIASLALRAMLYEVNASPKPGLVDRLNNGAHHDMDLFTFLTSSVAIYPYLKECAALGLCGGSLAPADLFRKIRAVGLQGEQAMFAATDGVNTQKGLLFALGIIAAAAGYAISSQQEVSLELVIATVEEMTSGLVDGELLVIAQNPQVLSQRLDRSTTAGEEVFLRYGAVGIRGEVEHGFPTVVKYGLPLFKNSIRQGVDINGALIKTLLSLMSAAEDSNVLWRAGVDGLQYMRNCARVALEAGAMQTAAGRKMIADMDADFISRNISPGGSADLLAVTAYLYWLEQEDFLC